MPRWNGPVLTLAKIIKFVISSASEAELGAMFVTAHKNGSDAANFTKNEVATAKIPPPDRQLRRCRCGE